MSRYPKDILLKTISSAKIKFGDVLLMCDINFNFCFWKNSVSSPRHFLTQQLLLFSTKIDLPGTSMSKDWRWVPTTGCTG